MAAPFGSAVERGHSPADGWAARAARDTPAKRVRRLAGRVA
jgi:hypothetical protein